MYRQLKPILRATKEKKRKRDLEKRRTEGKRKTDSIIAGTTTEIAIETEKRSAQEKLKGKRKRKRREKETEKKGEKESETLEDTTSAPYPWKRAVNPIQSA